MMYKSLGSVHFVNTFLGSSRLYLFYIKLYYEVLIQFKINVFSFYYTLKYNLFLWSSWIFSVTWSFRNYSDMLIYNQCRKKLCCLIFFGTCDIVQDSMGNKKLKRTVFTQNINVMLQYTLLFKSLGSVHFFFLIYNFIQQACVKWIKRIVKTYIVRQYLYF